MDINCNEGLLGHSDDIWEAEERGTQPTHAEIWLHCVISERNSIVPSSRLSAQMWSTSF